MPELYLLNSKAGQRRDAALREDGLLSWRTLKNFDIDYDGETADLVIRKGYDRWNSVELDDPATQLFAFVDQAQAFNLLGISGSRWRAIKESGAHVVLVNEAATATRPVESFGNRAFFATDTDAYWTDDSSIGGANPSYRLGIVKPLNAAAAILTASEGNLAGGIMPNAGQVELHNGLRLNDTARRRLAWTYTPATEQEVSNVILRFMTFYTAGVRGSLRVSIYSGVTTPTTLVKDATSD